MKKKNYIWVIVQPSIPFFELKKYRNNDIKVFVFDNVIEAIYFANKWNLDLNNIERVENE